MLAAVSNLFLIFHPMKLLVLLLSLLPLWAKAQLMEPLDRWGVRTAYTRTNGSYSFGFVGVSLNSTEVDPSGLAAAGAKVYAGAQIGKPDNWKIIPEVGVDAFFILPAGVGVSVNTEAVTPRIGITLINAIEFYWGYSFAFKEGNSFQGRTFSVIVNLYKGL